VRELADREAIRDLALRYADYLCRGEVEGLVNLFTKDGTFVAKSHEREIVSRGRVELKKTLKHAMRDVHPRHFIHTHLFEFRGGNNAAGRCYVELRTEKFDVIHWIGSGCYEDEYVKIAEEWKFASRRFVEIGMAIPLRAFIPS
jgi:hypothetical protein